MIRPSALVGTTHPRASVGYPSSLRILVAITLSFGLHTVGFTQIDARSPQEPIAPLAGNDQVAEVMRTFQPRGVQSDGSQPTPPEQAIETFELADGLTIDLVASEPDISQPLFLSWDSRGRMWVVQYRQYQFPAGLKIVRYDHHLRAVFDRVPSPPPNHTMGQDRITVFEDTDGDGTYDQHKDVITGLNIASSVAIGRGGIWVLNPPYLLFYPDEDRDDIPDGDPEVHLSGFGLQDTHAVANSLMWGPDGWLYGANGSTTGGTVSSSVTPGVTFQGQCIWRYHPVRQVFEIWAEGGGNTFSLDIDSKGCVFCGTNGGNTRGWYLPQGSYSRKNWGKHGPLTNPYAFGFFEAMNMEGDPRRFAQAFLIYEGGLFSKQDFDGTIVAPNSMQNLVWHSERIEDGSTFRTVDKANLVESSDRWFRPVYAGVGPDGAIYIADWYDTRLSHVSPTDDWHKESGRVYRVRPTSVTPNYAIGDMHELQPTQLIELFDHPNKWVRQRAVLELSWKEDTSQSILEQLSELVDREGSLEALWALEQSGGLSDERAVKWLEHSDSDIRRWVVRLLGDAHRSRPELIDMAMTEPDVHVRSQLAATAKRLSPKVGLGIAAGLLTHDDESDPHVPLMIWWAIESHAETWPEISAMFQNESIWRSEMMRQHIARRLMRRYAATETTLGLERCVALIDFAPNQNCRNTLIAGLNDAFQGRRLPPLREKLATALRTYQQSRGDAGLIDAIKQGDTSSIQAGVQKLSSNNTGEILRLEIAKAFGKQRYPAAEKVLLRIATNGEANPALRRVALQSLAAYDNIEIANQIATRFDNTISAEHGLRDTACRTLASRQTWAEVLLAQLINWRVQPRDIPADVVQRLRAFDDRSIIKSMAVIFGPAATISTPETVSEIDRVTRIIASGQGSATNGFPLFQEKCGKCHRLFGEGEQVAPPLDNYDRQNLKFWLPAIIAPNLEIREGYQTYLVLTEDDRVVTGMVHSQDHRLVTIRTADHQLISIPREDLVEFRALPTSLMPADLLKDLEDEQIRDLFAYLRKQ